MKKDWKYEIARDAMAIGSILFYIIVLARSTIGNYLLFTYQLLIALAILIVLSFTIKKANHHIARALVLIVFTSLFYQDNFFTIFVILLWIFMLGAAIYIKEKKEVVVKGIVIGVIAALASYYLSSLL